MECSGNKAVRLGHAVVEDANHRHRRLLRVRRSRPRRSRRAEGGTESTPRYMNCHLIPPSPVASAIAGRIALVNWRVCEQRHTGGLVSMGRRGPGPSRRKRLIWRADPFRQAAALRRGSPKQETFGNVNCFTYSGLRVPYCLPTPGRCDEFQTRRHHHVHQDFDYRGPDRCRHLFVCERGDREEAAGLQCRACHSWDLGSLRTAI